MDFRYSAEQEQFRQQIRQFLDDNVSDALREEIAVSGHSPGPLATQFLKLLGEQGWLGIGWPKEHGGQRRSMIEQSIFYHELDLQDIHYGNLTITSLALTLIKLASEEQKQQGERDPDLAVRTVVIKKDGDRVHYRVAELVQPVQKSKLKGHGFLLLGGERTDFLYNIAYKY